MEIFARTIDKGRCAAILPNTRMVFTETIANPGTQVADLAVIGEIYVAGWSMWPTKDVALDVPAVDGGRLVGDEFAVQVVGGTAMRWAAPLPTPACTTGPIIQTSTTSTAALPPAGLTQIKKKGLRDMGGTLAAEPGATHRRGGRDAGLAHTSITHRAGAGTFPARASRRRR